MGCCASLLFLFRVGLVIVRVCFGYVVCLLDGMV